MRFALLAAAVLCAPARAQVELSRALSDARAAAAASKDAREKADDAELKSWGVQLAILTRKNERCSAADCASMRRALADALRAVPPFLRARNLEAIFWDDPGDGTRPEGNSDGKSVSITVSSDALERVLIHELAHHYYEHHLRVTDVYLDIRFAKQPLWGELDALWAHIRANAAAGRPKVDDHVRAELRRLRVPRRNDDDVHLTEDYYEYWAGSVELYWLHHGDREALRPYLVDEEIDYLGRLFQDRSPRPTPGKTHAR